MIDDKETYAVIGACMEVHRELGIGFTEPVYQRALAVELADRHIPFRREVVLQVYYKGKPLEDAFYRADFICYDSIIVELKAVKTLSPEHEAQILNYMNICKVGRGLLVNFGESSLNFKRFVNNNLC